MKSALSALTIIILAGIMVSCQHTKTIDPQSVDSNEDVQKFLLRGWNTWNSSDLLSYVFMPEGLALKIGFRNTDINEKSNFLTNLCLEGNEAENARLIPVAHSSDGRYIEYYVEWKDFEAKIQVVRERKDINILYTPVKVPVKPPVLFLEVGMLWNKSATLERSGNIIQAGVGQNIFSIGATRNTIDVPLPLPTHYLTFTSDEEIGFYSGEMRGLNKIKNYIELRRTIHEEKHRSFDNLSEAFNVIESLLSWNMVYDAFNNETLTPVSRTLAERSGGWVLHNNDAYLISLLFSSAHNSKENWVDKFHAYSNAIAATRNISEDGFLPAITGPLSTGSSLHSSAPVGSLVCNILYKKYKDKWFLEAVYDKLLLSNRWWDVNRNNKGYLSWGSLPSGKNGNSRESAVLESELRMTSYFNDIPYNKNTHKLEIASVELMSLYITDCNSLAEIASVLGKEDDQNELLQRAGKYSSALEELWDESMGIYRDKNLLSNQYCTMLPATAFYSLLAGVPDPVKARRMISEHLLNQEEFGGNYMIPLIATNTIPAGDSAITNRLVIPEVNFLVYLGLKNYEFTEIGKILADKSMSLIMKEWGINKKVYPGYDNFTGLGSGIPGDENFFTPGGLLAMIPLIEGGYW